MRRIIRNTMGLLAVGLAFTGAMESAGAAVSVGTYYVRPYIAVGGGATIDGYVANGPTSSSQNFGSDFKTTVDLASGTVKAYEKLVGTNQSGQAGGTFGDSVFFDSSALGTNATFSFDYDGTISSGAALPGASTLQFGAFVNLFVYEAGSGATYDNFGNAAFDAYKVIGQSKFINFTNPQEDFYQAINDSLSGTFTIGGSGAYDIFAGLTLFAVTNDNPVTVEMDFSHTATLGIQTDPGVGFTSASGVLLTAVQGGVPEPATWALMILGFGMVGGAMRRRPVAKVTFA